jgi:hypothetical protein
MSHSQQVAQGSIVRCKRTLHFEVFWPMTEGYSEAVVRGWSCPQHISDPFRRLDHLFRNLIKELQSWSATRIGNIKTQLLAGREIVFKFDQAQDFRELSSEEAELRRELKLKCLGLSSLERTIARQRSRAGATPGSGCLVPWHQGKKTFYH